MSPNNHFRMDHDKPLQEAVMPRKELLLLVILVFAGGNTELPLSATAAGSNALESPRIREASHPGPSFPGLFASTSEQKEQEDIEAQVKKILEQIKQLQKKLDKKMQKEILPAIREKLEKLREWLKKYKKGHDKEKPQWTNRTPHRTEENLQGV